MPEPVTPPPLTVSEFLTGFPEFVNAGDMLIDAKITSEHALWEHHAEPLGEGPYKACLGYRVAVALARSPCGTNARLEALVPIYEQQVDAIVARLPGSPLVINHGRCP